MRFSASVVAMAVVLLCCMVVGCGVVKSKLGGAKAGPPSASPETKPAQAESGKPEQPGEQGQAGKPKEAGATGTEGHGEAAQAGEKPAGANAVAEAGGAGSSSVASDVIKGAQAGAQGATSGPGGAQARYVPLGAQRTLTNDDLAGKSKWELDILRNEIYAAHGRAFERSDLRQYFRRQPWYREDPNYSDSWLSGLEKRNAAFVADYQKRRGQAGGGSRRGGHIAPDGQVFYWSSVRRVTRTDLAPLSKWEVDIARNEIYARHGRPFKRADLRRYFRSLPWYHEDDSYSDGRLSAMEKRNAAFILSYQSGR